MLIASHGDYRRLWLGQLASQVGDRVQQLALLWWILKATGSAASMGLLMALSALPVVLLGPLAGSVVDRSDRRKVLVACDLARGLLVLAAAGLLYAGRFGVGHAYLLAGLLSLFSAFFNPALVASLPLVVRDDELPEAQACEQMTRDLAGLAGPAAGGLLAATVGIPGAVLLNGLSYLAAGLATLSVRFAPAPRATGASVFADLLGGLRYVAADRPVLRRLVGFGLVNLFSAPILFLLPVLVERRLSGGTLALGLLEACLAAGSILMALLIAWGSDEGWSPNLALPIGVSGAAFLALAAARSLLSAGAALVVVGMTVAAVNVGLTVHFQRTVPEGMKGRFFALVETVAFATFPLSFLLAGPLADRFGLSALFVASGLANLLLCGLFRR